MKKRLPLLLRNATYNLRGGFLVRPLAIALSLGFIGGLVSWLEEWLPWMSAWVPTGLFPSHTDAQVAQVILSGIASSIMTVVSIVFAILLMTLTLASSQFSPRIIVSFSKDRVTQQTLGIFLGTFCYCTAALPAARSVPFPFAPVATVVGAMLLAVACVGWLLFFIHHISHAISVNYIVDRIAAETEIVIDELMPDPYQGRRMQTHDQVDCSSWDVPVLSIGSGYIRYVDMGRLIALAKFHRVKIRVLRRVGHFVPQGVPLLMVSHEDRLAGDDTAQLRGAFDLGPSRTLQQDVEFGVLQIVDISLKAISPAVNDPSTAINGLDQLSRILIRFVSRESPQSTVYDPPGVPRINIQWISFDQLLESAFEQIRHYSITDVAVSLRILRALTDIATTTSEPGFRQSLVTLGQRVVRGCATALPEEDLNGLRQRQAALERLCQVSLPA